MSDRGNPILFGPEWLRNLPSERGSGNSGQTTNPNNQTAGPGTSGASGSSMAPPGHRRNGTSGETARGSHPSNQNQQASNGSGGGVRVQLANLRYGREEMLALYEAAAEPPQELKNNELLYQPRGKPPFALSTSFDEEMRDNVRSSSHAGGMSSAERFTLQRGGIGRGTTPSPDNTRPRYRASAINRSPTAASSAESQGDAGARPQLNSRPRYQPNDHKSFYLNYTANVMFRNKRQNTTNWNWRSQQTRESGEEWRGSRSGQERERDRERPGDRPHGGSSRRTLSDHNEESMPEWAYSNAEPCAGTFDSSGAFHGYSNDDSNLPKSSEGGYSLARSRTHNTLTRSKTVEEGSDEWWASEKAKKLSPKRFDAGDIKFKQGPGLLDGTMKPMSQNSKTASNKEDYDEQKNSPVESPEPDQEKEHQEYEEMAAEHKGYKQQFSENKSYETMMRGEAHMEEQSSDGGNFKSVMINTNNSLRQKHQNIVVAGVGDNQIPMNRSHPVMLKFQNQHMEQDHQKHHMLEEKMIDRFLDMSLASDDLSNAGLMGPAGSGVAMSGAVNPHQLPSQGMPMSLQGPQRSSPGLSLINAQHLSTLNLQPPTHNMPQGLPAVGMNNPMVMPPQMEFGPNSGMGLPMPGMPQGMSHGHGGNPLQNPGANMPSFQSAGNMPGMSNNAANTSMLFGKNLSNSSMPQTGDIPMPPNHNAQGGNLFPMHGLQHSSSQNNFGNSMFNNLLQSQPVSNPNANNIADQWFYEDPEKNTQGPFTSREMYRWYRAGFFTPSLMVRRACESTMRPLGSYGTLVPFAQLDVLPPFPMSGYETRAPVNHTGLSPSFDSLWGQPPQDVMWMHRNPPIENRVNNLPMYFWDQQASNSLMSEDITKEMKTEDQILAQLRATQSLVPPPNKGIGGVGGLPLPLGEAPAAATLPLPQLPQDDAFASAISAPYFEELQKMIHKDIHTITAPMKPPTLDNREPQPTKQEKAVVKNEPQPEPAQAKAQANPAPTVPAPAPAKAEAKAAKQTKQENEKVAKNKDNSTAKGKTKKSKEEKKEEVAENKKEDDANNKAEKRSVETSPVKNKKEEKANKKELEKEKKEWLKEGFTIVKGAEKVSKDSKKKAEEAKAAEEMEKKRKEEERMAAEDEKKKKHVESYKKQLADKEHQPFQPRNMTESLMKKAPWSAASASFQATSKEGLTLTEIQRLEREKKLEQMKEQQQMMVLLAQQQAAAMAREQEMQANLGWAKKKSGMGNIASQSLSEIQITFGSMRAETRKQASVAAAANQMFEEERPAPYSVPWTNTPNGAGLFPGGFWDSPTPQPAPQPASTRAPEKPQQEAKPKKKAASASATAANAASSPVAAPAPPAAPATPAAPKKEASPAVEFEVWCTTVLKAWSSKIDVPTFIGFLKDIESPYEVKDYVKCYLGDSKETGDFSRQFLERRSKLLRVGMVTPSDDLCSPAMAVNPRTNSGSDYQEGKGKKTKKNKMLKVDARILGFSVTAAEDRINVGDIDTA